MLLELTHVRKAYGEGEAQVRAVRDISFGIDKGEFAAVCGPSGSGKTTLLTIIGGMNRPTDGETLVDGISIYRELSGEGLAQFRSEYVGFVFQSFQLVPWLSALENVMLPLAPFRVPRRRKAAMAAGALEEVGIAEKANVVPSELSGGQRQRVAIARAIVNQPPLILADEPTGNLDTGTRDEILELLESIRKKGHTIIMVTHDPENIRLAQRVVAIRDGKLDRASCVGLEMRD